MHLHHYSAIMSNSHRRQIGHCCPLCGVRRGRSDADPGLFLTSDVSKIVLVTKKKQYIQTLYIASILLYKSELGFTI